MRFVIAFLLCSVATCNARLWDSTVQMEQRFGKPDDSELEDSPFGDTPGLVQKAYKRNGLICFAYFQDDKCICEVYARDDHDWLSEVQMKLVLESNEFGKQWHPIKGTTGSDYWIKDDRSARCNLMKGTEPSSMKLTVFAVPRYDEILKQQTFQKDKKERQENSFLSQDIATPVPQTPSSVAPAAAPISTPTTVALSQQAAIRKHPALGVKGTKLNSEFLQRYRQWQEASDWHLQLDNWPERLADECAKDAVAAAAAVPTPTPIATKWTTPHPPYPEAARASHITGTTTVEVYTDASGRVSSVSITQSAGNAILDYSTQVYVKEHWTGPPNSSHSTSFEYRLQ